MPSLEVAFSEVILVTATNRRGCRQLIRCHNMCIARAVGMMQLKVLKETRTRAHIIPPGTHAFRVCPHLSGLVYEICGLLFSLLALVPIKSENS